MENDIEEKAICRGCGKTLRGKPYRFGGSAYDEETGKRCKINFYGGYVCSWSCDKSSSLALERTMPGCYGTTTLSQQAKERLDRNWDNG